MSENIEELIDSLKNVDKAESDPIIKYYLRLAHEKLKSAKDEAQKQEAKAAAEGERVLAKALSSESFIFPGKSPKARMKTMFGEARHRYLADIISFKSSKKARTSVRALAKLFRAGGASKRLSIAKATMLAANRAEASSKRRDLSKKRKATLRAISGVYRRTAEAMYRIYRKMQ